jgi:sulfate adenylyltransferase
MDLQYFKEGGIAAMKTYPSGEADLFLLSGTMVRKTLSKGGEAPVEFSRSEAVKVLHAYYAGIPEKVEIKLHGAATGNLKKQ